VTGVRELKQVLSSGVPHQRQWHIVALFVGIVIFQLALGAISVDMLSAVRAYVGGESLWSKGQKDAWFHSTRYSESYAEDDYQKFRAALAVPLGDRRAREALSRPTPNEADAAGGFLAGDNHPDDVAGMIRLFRWFHAVPFMADAIAIWAQADAQMNELASLVEQAHERIDAGDLASPAVRALGTRLPLLNDRLTLLERQFSARLGDASRTTLQLLLALNLSLAALMLLAGLRFARRTIREHIAADRALRDSHERWEVAADAASLGLFEWRLADGGLTLDARASALYGLPTSGPCRIDAHAVEAMAHPDDVPRLRETARQAAAEARTLVLRYRIVRRDGTPRHLELTGLVSDRDTAAKRRLAGIVRDITDDVQAEQLRLEKVAAERASRAKSEFLARVSHELRTPLNAILGFGQLLQIDSRERLSVEQAQRVQHILHGGQHLLRLVEDILSVTSLESRNATLAAHDVAVDSAVAASMRQIAFMASAAGIEVRVETPPAGLAVRGDPVRIEQVLVNLLTNAIKYNRAGGQVCVDWTTDDATARINVRDTGRGLTPAQVDQLFQPFNRLGAEYTPTEGTGLGLVIVRELVERMGGTVEVRSEKNVGSCFTVCLPRATLTPEHSVGEASTTPP
jgi:signal transduction histidine kinase